MKVYDAGNPNGLTAEFNDNGNLRKTLKLQSFEQWARYMETSNNAHEDALNLVKQTVTVLDTRYQELEEVVTNLRKFIEYVADNYPSVMHEYTTAQRTKRRMDIDNDQPVTMGP